jgi:hypothetical protein
VDDDVNHQLLEISTEEENVSSEPEIDRFSPRWNHKESYASASSIVAASLKSEHLAQFATEVPGNTIEWLSPVFPPRNRRSWKHCFQYIFSIFSGV